MRHLVYVLALLLACGGAASPPPSASHGYHMRFDDAEGFAKRFDDPSRDAWQKPDEVLRVLALRPDSVVADVGSGTGYFAVRIARAVPQGRVYGVDVEASMTEYLTKRAAKEGLANLRAVTSPKDDPKLPEPVDEVLVVDTYHHIDARETYFAKVRASLKPGGRVVLVDFKLDSPEGPPAEHRVPPDQARAEMSKAGYRVEASPDVLPYQYVLVFTVP
ncbi:MAG TPA: class I SAM-dependent methyltransferase [Polyangiaceae bacterium]